VGVHRAYVRYGLENPGSYAVVFTVDRGPDAQPQPIGLNTFQVLTEQVATVLDGDAEDPRSASSTVAPGRAPMLRETRSATARRRRRRETGPGGTLRHAIKCTRRNAMPVSSPFHAMERPLHRIDVAAAAAAGADTRLMYGSGVLDKDGDVR
jgi:hypothetical protein